MIATAERGARTAPELSAAEATVTTREEVRTMSATMIDRHVERRARPSGLDRVVMRVSLAMLLWARRHADRAAVSREQQQRRYAMLRDLDRRSHDAAMLIARVR